MRSGPADRAAVPPRKCTIARASRGQPRQRENMDTLSGAILVFLVSSAFVIAAGVGLARFGDDLAEATGWGKLWVGTLLVGIATSLPEVTVNISAVWLEKSPGLALGNVFGADMMKVFVRC